MSWLGKRNLRCRVDSREIEVRRVFVVEGSVRRRLFFVEKIDRRFEVRVRFNVRGVRKKDRRFDLVVMDRREEER